VKTELVWCGTIVHSFSVTVGSIVVQVAYLLTLFMTLLLDSELKVCQQALQCLLWWCPPAEMSWVKTW